MGRRRLEVGEHGQIKLTQLASKKYRARCEVRCRDGRIRSVQADGPSKTAATDAVKKRAAERAASSGRPLPSAATAELTPVTKVSVLADKWMEQKKASAVSDQTITLYGVYHEIIKDGLGELRIKDVTTASCEWLIDDQASGRPSKAKNLRRQLSEMFALAIRHDAYDGANPAREVEVAAGEKKKPEALSIDELQAYREHIRAWQDAPAREDGKRGGRPRTKGLLDYVNIQLATGARINEVLALRWQDVDLQSEVPTAHICGTLVKRPKDEGGGLRRQEYRKARDQFTVILPRFAVDTLLRMKVDAVPNDWDVIFASSTNTLRSDSNLRTQLRAAQGETWKHVKTHTFRKTVATLVGREVSVEAASRQLGNSKATTERYYVAPDTVAPDLRSTLDKLAPTDG